MPRLTKTEAAARARLMPLIQHCAQSHGAKTQVLRRLKEYTDRKIHLLQVSAWLHPSPAKWKEPLYSTGVLLERIQAEFDFPEWTVSWTEKDPVTMAPAFAYRDFTDHVEARNFARQKAGEGIKTNTHRISDAAWHHSHASAKGGRP